MTAEEVITYFATLKNYHLAGYYIKTMEFQGNPEPTFVGWLKTDYARQSKIIADFEGIASVMTQESIALVTDEMELLVFDIAYTGDPYKFDPQYFEYFFKKI